MINILNILQITPTLYIGLRGGGGGGVKDKQTQKSGFVTF